MSESKERKKKGCTISATIDQEVFDKLSAACKAAGTTIPDLVRVLLTEEVQGSTTTEVAREFLAAKMEGLKRTSAALGMEEVV